jgi:hypothetical protein
MTVAPGKTARAQDVLDLIGLRALLSANLLDLPDKALARANLGLGTIATQASSAIAVTGGTVDGVSIGATTRGPAQFTTLSWNASATANGTGQFWANDGAVVTRLTDRLLVGAAVDNDAQKPNVVPDWLTQIVNWPVFNATSAITSRHGKIALTTASQTSDLDPLAADSVETTIGVASFAISNNPGTYPSGFYASYAFYGEAWVLPGTVSNSFGAELEALNLSGIDNGTPTPYRELLTGSVQALRLGSGGGQGRSPNTALSAIAIVPNLSTFNVGIVFEKGSITGTDGFTGFGTAIAMAKGHLVAWYADGGDGIGEGTFFLTSTVTAEAYRSSIQAQNGGLLFIQPNDKIGVEISTVPDTANGIALTPAAAGSSVSVRAFGDDTSVSLGLHAKGADGVIRFTCGTQSSAAAGSGSAIPTNADAFMRIVVNDQDYVLPLLKAVA